MKSKAKLIIYKNNHLLLLKKKGVKLKYVLLGGSIDKGETPIQAALREAHEEGNITCEIDKVKFLSSAIGIENNRFIYSYYFLTHDVTDYDLMEPHKFLDLDWVHQDIALPYMREVDRNAIKRILED